MVLVAVQESAGHHQAVLRKLVRGGVGSTPAVAASRPAAQRVRGTWQGGAGSLRAGDTPVHIESLASDVLWDVPERPGEALPACLRRARLGSPADAWRGRRRCFAGCPGPRAPGRAAGGAERPRPRVRRARQPLGAVPHMRPPRGVVPQRACLAVRRSAAASAQALAAVQAPCRAWSAFILQLLDLPSRHQVATHAAPCQRGCRAPARLVRR